MDNEFNTNGFRIIRNIIDVSDWYKKAKTQESIGQYDNQSPNSPSVYNGLNELQEIIKPIIEEKTELDLYKTYIEFLENENAYINMEKKDGEKERTKREAKKARGKSKE